jgi:hypothetical protein
VKVAVVHAGKQVLSIRLPMRQTHIQFPVQVRERVRASIPRARTRVCVTGVDPSGNRSARSCIALRR